VISSFCLVILRYREETYKDETRRISHPDSVSIDSENSERQVRAGAYMYSVRLDFFNCGSAVAWRRKLFGGSSHHQDALTYTTRLQPLSEEPRRRIYDKRVIGRQGSERQEQR
jgi:hypothetical protein